MKRFTLSGAKTASPTVTVRRAEPRWDGNKKCRIQRRRCMLLRQTYHGKPVYFDVLGPWNRPEAAGQYLANTHQ